MTKQIAKSRLPRWNARMQRPLTYLLPLIERLENDARTACVNHRMRDAMLQHWRSRVFLPTSRISRFSVEEQVFFYSSLETV